MNNAHIDTTRRIEFDTDGWVRLEVAGHYMGIAHPASGIVLLYYRGKTRVFNLAEMQGREQTTD